MNAYSAIIGAGTAAKLLQLHTVNASTLCRRRTACRLHQGHWKRRFGTGMGVRRLRFARDRREKFWWGFGLNCLQGKEHGLVLLFILQARCGRDAATAS
ncbi:hypothetical protein [Noviherbaspirillum sp.]|uniref:hypothetical protein n=1 Tax=Noviherbaspirillum sp. TaxID=1926288 RepID=UPI002B4A69F4|nr:hypothetical protein [Noviherbaspirillum sp.]HJV82027.1 hypothetical protein [Noviherbaspirillum sp.]